MKRTPYDGAIVVLVVILVAGMLTVPALSIAFGLGENFRAVMSVVIVSLTFLATYRVWPHLPRGNREKLEADPTKK